LVTKPVETVPLSHANGCPAWVQANDEAHGYYYVDYSAPLLDALDGTAKTLPATERLSFIANGEALSKAGKLSAGDSLKLVETFHADSEPAVLSATVKLAFAPMEHLVPASLAANYRRFLDANFGARARELGWIGKPGESDDLHLLRQSVVPRMATRGGDQALAGEARRLAKTWFSDHHSLDANIAGPVLSTAAFYGDAALFDRFVQELRDAKDEQVRRALLDAMLGFRDRAAIEKGMEAELNGDVPPVFGFRLLFAGGGQESTRKMGFAFVKAHYDQIVEKFSSGGSAFDFLGALPFVGGSFCDAESRDELKAFFAPRAAKLPGAERSLAQASERIDLCIANKATQEASVAEFLAKY
jgi:alanyl aminopeptidase